MRYRQRPALSRNVLRAAHSAPAQVVSDLRRSAKSDSRNIEFWSANDRYAYESPKNKEVAGFRKRRGEAIAIKKNHQHEETKPTQMKVSRLRKNTELNQSLQTISCSVTVAAEPLCVPPHEMSDLKR
jgi:hypothetical protein